MLLLLNTRCGGYSGSSISTPNRGNLIKVVVCGGGGNGNGDGGGGGGDCSGGGDGGGGNDGLVR